MYLKNNISFLSIIINIITQTYTHTHTLTHTHTPTPSLSHYISKTPFLPPSVPPSLPYTHITWNRDIGSKNELSVAKTRYR